MGSAPSEPHPPCADPSAVEARYLLAMFDLERAGGTPTQAEVARSVGVSAPTALEMIRRLRGMGFVEPDTIDLTHAGQSAALVLSSRRAAAHALVHDVLGIEDELSRSEADHLATSVSAALGRRLLAGRERTPRPRA
jgi:Mn-dependent DtxR family transcriptional regulator